MADRPEPTLSSALAPLGATPTAALAAAVESAAAYAEAAVAPATRAAYAADLAGFRAWCDLRGACALPAEATVVALYLSDLADGWQRPAARPRKGDRPKMATIDRALVAISQAHLAAGLPSPRASLAVKTVRRGIARTLGTAPRQKAAAVVDVVRQMVSGLPTTTRGVRDRALLLLGFAGAFRRSELVALDVADLVFDADGLTVTIRRSKTDQEGVGRLVPVAFGANPATCPVRAVRAWLDAASIPTGAVFRGVNRHEHVASERLSACAVALVVKRAAAAAGLDPTMYAGHSLRAGLATTAARAGRDRAAIRRVTGHRSDRMLDVYIRRGRLFDDCVNQGIGL